jgi:hypothetical protein
MSAGRPDHGRRGTGGSPGRGDADPGVASRVSAVEAIVRRAGEMSPSERRRLGRWTSASLRDPRLSSQLEAARGRALAALDDEADRRRRWDRATRPLHDALVTNARGIRIWRIVMLASHLMALLAIANLPAGLSRPIAFAVVLLAPISAWASWGRGLAPLGAIHAALAAALSDRVDADDLAGLRRSWQNAIELDPPARPPLLGAVGAMAPSVLLIIAFFAVVIANPR